MLTPALAIGDIVRLKPEFINRFQGHIEDVCGEVVAVGKRTARVTWDDGQTHSSLLSNLELAALPNVPSLGNDYADGIGEQRAKLLVSAATELKSAWRKLANTAATPSR